MAISKRELPIGIDQPHTPGAASKRIAAALGWDQMPEVTEDQVRKAHEQLDAAREQLRDDAA